MYYSGYNAILVTMTRVCDCCASIFSFLAFILLAVKKDVTFPILKLIQKYPDVAILSSHYNQIFLDRNFGGKGAVERKHFDKNWYMMCQNYTW